MIPRIGDISWVEIDTHNVPVWVGRGDKASHRTRSAAGVENARAGPVREMAQITFETVKSGLAFETPALVGAVKDVIRAHRRLSG